MIVHSLPRLWSVLFHCFFLAAAARCLPVALIAQSAQALSGPVDVTLTRRVEVTGDGKNELIVLHVKGADFMKPFSWTLEIRSKGLRVFMVERHDARINEFFADTDYIGDCAGYAACKRKYYFEEILDGLVSTNNVGPAVFDRSYPGSIYSVAGKFLRTECKVSERQAKRIIDLMVVKLQSGKATILSVPIEPRQTEFPMMYSEEVKKFVRFYEW